MIYLPHPNYNFEDEKGRSGAVAQLERRLSWLGGLIDTNLNLDLVCKVFPSARSNYWENTITKGDTFCFLREDGAEFAIRVIPNVHMDVMGYWKDIPCSTEDEEFTKFIRWLENETNEKFRSYCHT